MSVANFKVEFDSVRRTLISRVSGCWTPEITHEFLSVERDVLGKSGYMPRQIKGLIDARDFFVQSPEVADILKNPANVMANVKRLAFIAPSPESVIQIRKTMPFEHASVFATEADAWNYLRILVG